MELATTHQVLERFWGLRGLSVSQGWRCVRQLIEDGWLQARALDRSAGTTSRQLLTLTHRARVALAAGGWPPAPVREHEWVVEHRLQQTQMLIEREAEGWVLASADEIPALLKQVAIAGWRGRRPFGIEEDWHRRIHSWHPTPVPLGALRHRSTGAVRLILPVRAGFDVRGTLRRLDRPSLAILSTGAPIAWELVGACTDDVDTAEVRLRAWAKRRPRQRRRRPGVPTVSSKPGGELPVRIEVYRTAPYRDMPHPHRRGRRCVDVYAANGVSHPLELR